MVKIKEQPYLIADGGANVAAWLAAIAPQFSPSDLKLIRQATVLTELAGEDAPVANGESCLRRGLALADILVELKLDKDTIAAALVYSCVQHSDLTIEDVHDHLGAAVAKLVAGTAQLDAIRILQDHHEYSRGQIENLRKMLLAMVEDVRVVLIKLAERTCIMRTASVLSVAKQQQYAKETLELYAPLANRLGIGQLKWELEDLAFRYLEPATYKSLAKQLDERRIDREQYIQTFMQTLRDTLQQAGLRNFEVSGRVKHLYGIYRKMQRKKLGYEHIYDVRAVRVLVPTVADCYKALSIVHELWPYIPEEFDDYIAVPKPNGYRSLHTVVLGAQEKNIEVQIRTVAMHQEAELGIAAHWLYKEGVQQKTGYADRIVWLRQVLGWQQDLAGAQEIPQQAQAEIFADRVYVFTPKAEIIDLPRGATPLDFAYHIHSEIGHRCRGAKVNGNIVPLTHVLATGEQVEILTTREANPSRDWLSPHLGYLRSSKARAKVHHWFKQQDFNRHLAEGQHIMEREQRRLNLSAIDYDRIAAQINFKTGKDMLAALGAGDIRVGQILNALQEPAEETAQASTELTTVPIVRPTAATPSADVYIHGVGDLLTHTARCCQPVPGEPIIGFITQGRGIAIHRQDCLNITHLAEAVKMRLIDLHWGEAVQTVYPATIYVHAYDRQGLLRDIVTVLSNEKINLIATNTLSDKTEHIAHLTLTIEIPSLAALSKVLAKIHQLPSIISAERQLGQSKPAAVTHANTENKPPAS